MTDDTRTREYYARLFREHGRDVKALGWSSRESQEVRFRQFLRFLDLKDKVVLDVGCGFGDMFGFLDRNGCGIASYIGVDFSEHSIEDARKTYFGHSRARFLLGRFEEIESSEIGAVDYVLVSGAFAWESVSKEEHTRIVQRILRRAWAASRRGIAFNMMNEYGISRHRESERFDCSRNNYDPAHWLRFVMEEFTARVQFVSDYHDLDYTIVAHRAD